MRYSGLLVFINSIFKQSKIMTACVGGGIGLLCFAAEININNHCQIFPFVVVVTSNKPTQFLCQLSPHISTKLQILVNFLPTS